MKYFFAALLSLFLNDTLKAQTPPSFVLSGFSSNLVQFTENNIYFNGLSGLVKTDYSGNVIWAKPYVGWRMVVEDDVIYTWDYRNVYKLDTIVNYIWSKEIPYRMCSMWTDTSWIQDVIVDHNRIYVSTLQCPPQGSVDHCKVGVITMDTSGTVVNAWCDPYGLYSIWGVNTGCKSSSRGAFLSWKTTTGIFDQSFIARLDSSGNFDFFSQVQDYFYGDYNEVAGILPLPDSTYFIINNVTPIMTWPNMKTIVARMNENGTVIWQKEFRSASTGYQYLQFIYATTDGFGNIYIIGVVNEDSFCIIKIDLYGNQLFSKLWKYPSPSLGTLHFPNYISNINQMHYKDGNLYCYARNGALNESAILVFDTAFSISCYLPDTIYADSIFNSIPTQRTFTQFPTSSVVLTSDSLPMGTAIVPNVIYPCTQVQISEFPSLDQSLIVWPNPVFNEMHLKFTSGNDEMQQHFRFMLCNSMGAIVFEDEITSHEKSIDMDAFPAGLYFIIYFNKYEHRLKPILKF